MPTDILAVIKQRRAERFWATQEEAFILVVPALFGALTMALSIRCPAFAAIVIWAGLQ